jgi:chlorophyllide a reductase subunit Y
VHVQYRASLEDDLYAMKDAKPDLALGTTPLVQAAKEMGIPSIYFTNMVSARPLFGPAGAGSLAGIVAAQTKGKERFTKMLDFFGEIGTGDMAGYGWTESRVEAAKKAAAEKPAVVAATDDKSDKKASITDAKAGKEDTLEMAIGN